MTNYFKKIWSYRKGKFAISILCFFLFLAVFADFIANDKPIYCKVDGIHYFPVAHSYVEAVGLAGSYPIIKNKSWSEITYDAVLYPFIKFSADQIESFHQYYKSPGSIITNGTIHKKYWLGSDSIGRDVAAGMVGGARKALLIAFVAMLIALTIGLFLSALSGYFGDRFLEVNSFLLIGTLCLLGFVFFQLLYGHLGLYAFVLALIIIFVLFFRINKKLTNSFQVFIPFDIIVMRLIEIFKSIPALFILLAVLPLIKNPSLYYVIVILGLLLWPTITRLLRGEFLKIKSQEYIKASRSLGLSHFQILHQHVLPNALPTLITILAFGFSSTVLLEATISFLGIGLGVEEVTWGSLLSEARGNFTAWWLAIFPGMAIFLLVIAFNYLGELTSEIGETS